MAKLNAGDLVEARKDEIRHVERLDRSWNFTLLFRDWGQSVHNAKELGYSLSLVEAATPPPPPLPLEPGHYLLEFLLTSHVYTLSVEGYWWDGSIQVSEEKMQYQVANAENDPVRLEPVPDIAKKVIDATIRTFNSKGGNIVDALISVSQEFGVSDARG